MAVMTLVFNVAPQDAMGVILVFGIFWGLVYLIMEFGEDL